MKQLRRDMAAHRNKTTDPMFSRRSALSSSDGALLGMLAGSAFGQTENKEADAERPVPPPPREVQEGTEKAKALMERMRNAGSEAERQQVMNEQIAWQRQVVFESLKSQLRISGQEWPVVKPRLQAVYDLVHPVPQMVSRNETPKTEVEQKSRELRELLSDDKPDAERIKAKLAAYRAAKGKANQGLAAARQSLRQIMDVRQEAVLVLNGLLD